MAEPMHDLSPELDAPSPDDEWLERLIEWADETATTEYEGDAQPADVLAQLVDGAEFHRPPPEQARRWTVTDDGSADWAMRHVVKADEVLAELATQAQVWRDEATERLARIDAWFAHGAKRHLATRAFMEAHLVAYALDRREADPKHAKTLVLPSGVVKTTEQQPKAGVEDNNAVATWVTCWFPEAVAEVCPPVQPKVYVGPLRAITTVVEVIDHARLVLANSAEVVEWVRSDWLMDAHADQVTPGSHTGDVCPQQGDGWPTPDEATDLVAMVQVLATHPEVHDANGKPVPGTKVEPGGITAKVVPAP